MNWEQAALEAERRAMDALKNGRLLICKSDKRLSESVEREKQRRREVDEYNQMLISVYSNPTTG
jgi:hypothetical protein